MTIITHLVPSCTPDGRLTHVHLRKTVRNVASGPQSSRKYPCGVEGGMKGNRIADRSEHGIDNYHLLVCALHTTPGSATAPSVAGCSARDRRGANERETSEEIEMIGLENELVAIILMSRTWGLTLPFDLVVRVLTACWGQ